MAKKRIKHRQQQTVNAAALPISSGVYGSDLYSLRAREIQCLDALIVKVS